MIDDLENRKRKLRDDYENLDITSGKLTLSLDFLFTYFFSCYYFVVILFWGIVYFPSVTFRDSWKLSNLLHSLFLTCFSISALVACNMSLSLVPLVILKNLRCNFCVPIYPNWKYLLEKIFYPDTCLFIQHCYWPFLFVRLPWSFHSLQTRMGFWPT